MQDSSSSPRAMINNAVYGDGTKSSPDPDIEQFVVNKLDMMKHTQTAIKRAALLGAFVPDYVLRDEDLVVPSLRKFNAVVFMTDISGFTSLTETYSIKGKGGTDQLTKTLANYMGPLAECILRTNGDIYKFAGDAFLSVWELESPAEAPEVIQRVVDCALYCQEKYGQYLTDVQVIIKVKIGIGVGECYAAALGDRNYHHYVLYGPGIYAASSGEHKCESGDVVIHPSVWEHCNPKHFSYSDKGEGYVKVTDILHFLDPSKRGRPIVSQRITTYANTNKLSLNAAHETIRPHLDNTFTNSSEDRLRKYMIPPVLKKLDDDMPLEYLNESRIVSIVFIHVDYGAIPYTDEQYGKKIGDIVQKAFTTILKCATSLNGCLTKVIMFDKGLTYLVVFGLPGYIQDNQTANSLNFAYKMKPALKTIPNVSQVSIGCTTGFTYCGILGHPRRHEYTVIGKKVNKAARLMVYYPGKVTCDQDTFYSSKLPGHYFQQQEKKDLKGITNVGTIYEYLSSDSDEDSAIRRYEYPLLDRKTELDMITGLLRSCYHEFKTAQVTHQASGVYNTHSALDFSSSGYWMMIIEGENGIGKSRFLAACIAEAEMQGWLVFSVALNLQHATFNLYAVTDVLFQAFKLEGIRSSQEREEVLRKIAIKSNDPEIISGIATLNDVLHLKLATPPKFAYVDAKARHSFAQHTVMQLLRHTYPDKMILFCIEDAHFMQQESWEYFNHISRLSNVMTLMTLRRNSDGLPKIPDVAYKICYHSPHVKTIQLRGLPDNYILPLACQLMEVRGIPAELENILVMKSIGNPYWVEDVLNDLIVQSKIKIEEYKEKQKIPQGQSINFVVPKYITREKHLTATPVVVSRMNAEDLLSDESTYEYATKKVLDRSSKTRTRQNPENRICVLTANSNISTNRLTGGLKENVLDTFDSLNTNDQMVLKCACVLGLRFSRSMLHRLLPQYGKDARKYLVCFQRLMEANIFQCATLSAEKRATKFGKIIKTECECAESSTSADFFTHDYQEDYRGTTPKYAFCRYSEFKKENMVEVVYELLTEDLKKELHLKAAKYLETSAIQCMSCGGTDIRYVYGLELKNSEMSGENEEEAIAFSIQGKRNWKKRARTATDSTLKMKGSSKLKRHRSATSKTSSSTSKTGSGAGDNKASWHDPSKARKAKGQSLSTRIQGLRSAYESGGGQLAGIEFDILHSLIQYNKESSRRNFFCRCFSRSTDESLLVDIENKEKEGGKELGGKSSDMSAGSKKNGGSGKTAGGHSGGTGSLNETQVLSEETVTDGDTLEADEEETGAGIYDFRGCECTSIQALVTTEMIKHYRKAEKNGKCVIHIMDAADSCIGIGATNQGVNYIEEAKKMIEEINDGVLKQPNHEDPDDALLIDKEIRRRLNFLQGLANFELGDLRKAKGYFLKCLELLNVAIPDESNNGKVKCEVGMANFKIWRVHHAPNCCRVKVPPSQADDVNNIFLMKLRSFSYLQKIFRDDRNIKFALLLALWQVVLVSEMGDSMNDEIHAYCNMMEMWSSMGNHSKSHYYEKKSLDIIKLNWGLEQQVDPVGLLSSANLFLTLATLRLQRGELELATQASYLVNRVSKLLRDNSLASHVYPTLVRCLLYSLKVTETIETLHTLWYVAQAEDNWPCMAMYFCLTLDVILDLGFTIESFYYCEQFVTGKDWEEDIQLFREFDMQFNFETSLSLWYSRFSKWEEANHWLVLAYNHLPSNSNMLSVGGLLKLLQCYLIRANYHQTKKRYKLLAKDQKLIQEIVQKLNVHVEAIPVFKPRLYHLLAYASRIKDRKKDAQIHLRRAGAIAENHNNRLETEFIKHSRIVWASMANPAVKYYWIEHVENNVLDWRAPGTNIPWANIMYSLPLPAWT